MAWLRPMDSERAIQRRRVEGWMLSWRARVLQDYPNPCGVLACAGGLTSPTSARRPPEARA